MAATTSHIDRARAAAKRIRRRVLEVYGSSGGGHYGGSLSCADILAVLYTGILRVNPEEPLWPHRDRFILGKGHACGALLCMLAEAGFVDQGSLSSFNQFGSGYGMHPDMKRIHGCDMSTGSLGHGLSVGVGMAMAAKYDCSVARVFVLMGDGELQEGQVWEAAMAASQFGLDNLIAIVDNNRYQLDGSTAGIMEVEPLVEKWAAFGWSARRINGHEVESIVNAMNDVPMSKGSPTVIVADTVKGYGVSFMENTHSWHYGALTSQQLAQAIAELDARGL